MQQDEKQHEIWLGLASFVHYVKEYEKHSSFEKRGDARLLFWPDRKNNPSSYHPFKILIEPERDECGWVYTNVDDLNTILKRRKKTNFLIAQCKRYGPVIQTVSHCQLEKSKRGKISTSINESTGETADCLDSPAEEPNYSFISVSSCS